MNLSFGKCNGKGLSEKAGIGNWGTGWGEWWEYGESGWECGEQGLESGFRLIFENWNYKG